MEKINAYIFGKLFQFWLPYEKTMCVQRITKVTLKLL